jgi:hypothetical protein
MGRGEYILEVVIVVVSVSKINTRVVGYVRSGRNDSSPCCLVNKWVLLRVGCKNRVGFFEVGEACLG